MKSVSYRMESGQEYSLEQIFNGKNRIVIPDLQRDYCWGDKAWNKDKNNYNELVSKFLEDLILSFKDNPGDKLMLGLIYGYENPHYHIQLCDGQQRLTTLFLLMGMINRKVSGNKFQKMLISDDTLTDDSESNLQYAIRESTVYFLNDLVDNFFLSNSVDINDIKKGLWYFNEYDLDASIQSMLSAINIIDAKLNGVDCDKFGDFVKNNIQMLYYDMGNRARGEETFVVINTTGEPLTATENLKPIVIGNISESNGKEKISEEWEDREEWFWLNRDIKEQTSDDALKDFFIWYWQIRLLQEKSWKDKKSYPLDPRMLFQKKPLVVENEEETPDVDKWEESKNLNTVHEYFNALKVLVDKCKEDKYSKVLKTIKDKDIVLSWFRDADLVVVLPLIAYCQKFPDLNLFYKFVRRIRKNYFDKEWNDRNSNFVDWRHIIQIIQSSESEEEVFKFQVLNSQENFKKISNVSLNEWYNEEERIKSELGPKQIESWEDHMDFMGDLSFFISLCEIENTNNSLESWQKYYNNYSNVVDLIRGKASNPATNTYRLFLLFIDNEMVEHKPRVSWDIEGVIFSSIGRNQIYNNEFKKMCTKNDIYNYCLTFIKNKINEWDLFNLDKSNFTTKRALKCWLTLKVFYANMKKVCLSYYDGNQTGVSVNRNADANRLLGDPVPFSIYNMICGFGVKSGGAGSYIHYTSESYWLNPEVIDSPFYGVSRKIEERTIEQLDKNKQEIESIIERIKSINPISPL